MKKYIILFIVLGIATTGFCLSVGKSSVSVNEGLSVGKSSVSVNKSGGVVIAGDWILETNFWVDSGVWKDTSTWND